MNAPIKVISIQQPFTSLIAFGEKKFETRSWATKYRGELAIHAGKKIDKQAALMIAEKYPEVWNRISPLPTGVILAVCRLDDCLEIGTDGINPAVFAGDYSSGYRIINGREFDFGDYTLGRRAWELKYVDRIEPIPAKGQLGLWTYSGDLYQYSREE